MSNYFQLITSLLNMMTEVALQVSRSSFADEFKVGSRSGPIAHMLINRDF